MRKIKTHKPRHSITVDGETWKLAQDLLGQTPSKAISKWIEEQLHKLIKGKAEK